MPYTLIGATVDVRIRGDRLDVFHDGTQVASHQVAAQRGAFITDAGLHGPPGMEIAGNLWSADYFRTQASRIGPATRAVIDALFDHRTIPAQAYQPARSILQMGKGGNKHLLEEACERLMTGRQTRKVSYTAVKTMMAALRAEQTSRPQTSTRAIHTHSTGAHSTPVHTHPRTGMLGGVEQFRLTNLTGQEEGQA